MAEKYVTEESFDSHRNEVSIRIKKVEDDIADTKTLLAENKGYHKASLNVLNDIKDNTKTTKEEVVDLKLDHGKMRHQFDTITNEFESVKTSVKDKRQDNKDIIIKLLWLVGTLGAAALGASWIWM